MVEAKSGVGGVRRRWSVVAVAGVRGRERVGGSGLEEEEAA
jgi:hypothetical protein